MLQYVVESHTDPDYGQAFTLEDLVLDDQTVDDPRNGWHDTRYVCTKRYFGERYDIPVPIGMCAEDYEKRS